MASILHFRKELVRPPVAPSLAGISVRPFRVPDDLPAWLALRERATAELVPRPRLWTEEDFRSEMLSKPWWRADRTWVATADSSGSERAGSSPTPLSNALIGAVTLAERQGAAGTMPIIHWLLADPEWRRRGIGRLLISRLERAAWDAGWRDVQLETHTGWQAAVAFYQSTGYAPVRDRSPR